MSTLFRTGQHKQKSPSASWGLPLSARGPSFRWDSDLFAGLALDRTGLPRLIGRPSLRMMSLLYPEQNMLRTTTALLGGAIGGADAMAALGHDYLSGESEEARRLARMTQLIMIEESSLSRSLDPASGSAFIENRTDDLASAAWTQFQTIEAQGGLPIFAEAGSLAAWADDKGSARPVVTTGDSSNGLLAEAREANEYLAGKLAGAQLRHSVLPRACC